MEFLVCDGTITNGAGGEPVCSGSWMGTTDGPVLTLAELSSSDVAVLLGAAMVTMALAYGLRVIRKQMGF